MVYNLHETTLKGEWLINMLKTAICYFSGTGNSLDVSTQLQERISGSLFFIPRLKINDLIDYDRIILVTPIFSFGLPFPTKRFIDSLKIYPSKEYYVILHYGGFSGNAAHYTKQLYEKNGLIVRNIFKLKMPESYTLFMSVPQSYIRRTLKSAPNKIEKIAQDILNCEKKKIHKNIFFFCDKIHEVNAAKWPTLSQLFTVTDSCKECGLCADICPELNITMDEGKPQFHSHCAACLACYQRCPNMAINFGTKTIGRKRYFNPNVDFTKMK